jgi:hypothetical protein
MATFVVCSRCGKVQEIAILDQLPKGWQRSLTELYCAHCADTDVLSVGSSSDIIDEEVIYPTDGAAVDDTLDEGFCEVCTGPCRGH